MNALTSILRGREEEKRGLGGLVLEVLGRLRVDLPFPYFRPRFIGSILFN